MNWLLIAAIILLIFLLVFRYKQRKNHDKLVKEIKEKWGSSKKDELFSFDEISRYFNYKKKAQKSLPVIDQHTADDLDLKAIFKMLDRTNSKVGQQYLYWKIHSFSTPKVLSQFQKRVDFFKTNVALREKFQFALASLNTVNAYELQELFTKDQEKPKLIGLIYALTIAAILCIVLAFFKPVFVLFLLPIFAVNMVFHYRNKLQLVSFLNGVKQLSIGLKVLKTFHA